MALRRHCNPLCYAHARAFSSTVFSYTKRLAFSATITWRQAGVFPMAHHSAHAQLCLRLPPTAQALNWAEQATVDNQTWRAARASFMPAFSTFLPSRARAFGWIHGGRRQQRAVSTCYLVQTLYYQAFLKQQHNTGTHWNGGRLTNCFCVGTMLNVVRFCVLEHGEQAFQTDG